MARIRDMYNGGHMYLQFHGPNAGADQGTEREISRRKYHAPTVMDWVLAARVGVSAALDPYIIRSYTRHQATFVDYGWQRLFDISDDTYLELTVEFLTTLKFSLADRSITDECLSFRLGGIRRRCTLMEFAARVGIYTEEEVNSPEFISFFQRAHCQAPAEFNAAGLWSELTRPVQRYNASVATVVSMHQPLHRIMHRLITTTIATKPSPEKVSHHDLFLMWGLLNETRHLNLPYLLAAFLYEKGGGARNNSTVCGGQFVTRLAQSYNINLQGLTSVPCQKITMGGLQRLHVLEYRDGGYMFILQAPAPAQQNAPAPADQGRARRRRAASPPRQEPHEVNLQHISDQLTHLGFYQDDLRGHMQHLDTQMYYNAQHQHMMMHHMQMRPQYPIAPTYPSYPTWQTRVNEGVQRYNPQGGGAGPSGVGRRGGRVDDDDDDDDDEEEEEGETTEDEDYDGED